MSDPSFQQLLQAAARRHLGNDCRVVDAQPLTGGAASTTWRFVVEQAGQSQALILRLTQGGERIATGIDKRTEAQVHRAAIEGGVPAARVLFGLDPEDRLGEGFAMECLDGESIPQKILRHDEFAEARNLMTGQCGSILAAIHAVDANAVAGLPQLLAQQQLAEYESIYRGYGEAIAPFELAFRWLESRCPHQQPQTLVHGDFRNGNFLVEADQGIVAVLDWELAHLGDPMEDLGWLCVNSWRFGNRDLPVGGFGSREALFSAYEAATGQSVDPERVRFWEVFGTLRWGVMCLYLAFGHLDGSERSVERAAIGRRVSETEIDLLQLL